MGVLHEIPEGFPNSFLERDSLSLVCVKCRGPPLELTHRGLKIPCSAHDA